MAFKAPNPNSSRKVSCPYDTGEPKTVFTISEALPYGIRVNIKDKYSEFTYVQGQTSTDSVVTQLKTNSGKRNVDVVKHGLLEVENFTNADGSPFVLKRVNGVLDDASLQSLSIPINQDGFDTLIDWIAAEIWNANIVTDEERKN